MEYTERTRLWLDERVSATIHSGRPKPSYYAADGSIAGLPVEHVLSLARALTVLESLSRVDAATVLDVGAGTGWMAFLMREHLGLRAATVDLSREFAACSRRSLGIPSYVADAAALPFADASFDAVVCSEVIEHVEYPLAVLGELRRVARNAVIVTTQESCRRRWQRRLRMAVAEDTPHAERNYFLPADFAAFFGPRAEVGPLMRTPERVRSFDLRTVGELAVCVAAIAAPAQVETASRGDFGVRAAVLDGAALRPARPRDDLLNRILASDRKLGGASGFRVDWLPAAAAAPAPVGVEPRCPVCRAELVPSAGELSCAGCGASYAIDREVPVLIAPAAVTAANDQRQRSRPEVSAVATDLSRGSRVPSAALRAAVRASLQAERFLKLPIAPREKASLAWRTFIRPH